MEVKGDMTLSNNIGLHFNCFSMCSHGRKIAIFIHVKYHFPESDF